ncbi:MAG: hypothetical protein Kow0042_01070 [Calditrichia bacterium]
MSHTSIAILHYSCPPVVGGVEEIVRQQASLFHRKYHPVKILAGMGEHFTEEYEIEINPLLSSRNKEITLLQKDVSANFAALKRISEQIRIYLSHSLASFDVVIAHNVLTMPYNLPLTLALHALADEGRKKIISWNHDSPYFYSPVKKELVDDAWKILEKYNPNISYITISESRRQEFQQLYGIQNTISVIQNGIDPIRFLRLARNSVQLIQQENLFNCELLMMQPSRLHPRKNIELSIRILKAMHDAGVKAKLLLTGAFDPHEKKTLAYYHKLRYLADELQISDHLIIVSEYQSRLGEKLSADRVIMRDLYMISDILLLPSKQEGFGIPLLEAGMIRLPIACADIPPFRHIGRDNVLYFSLKDSPQHISGAILKFLNEQQPHRFFKRVIQEYTWDNIYETQLRPLLQSI